MYRRYIKRGLDIIFSALGLIVVSPLLLIIALAVWLEDPGPVLFRQRRFGIHRSSFNIVKFRSMRVDTPHDVPTHLLENPQQWITPVGLFLRKTSLDELPQLAQVLAGKMSLIGPRPALWNQEDLVVEREKYGANDVTPGITGWAQVNGRDALNIADKARYDGEYAQKLSFGLDAKIFFKSVEYVLSRKGVVEGGTGTLEKEKDK